MIKRCTNSACRKKFSTLEYGNTCPHCGKGYPQLKVNLLSEDLPVIFSKDEKGENIKFANLHVIFHADYPKSNKLKAARVVRDLVRCYENRTIAIKEAKDIIDGIYDLKGIAIDEANSIRSEVKEYGCKVKIIQKKYLTASETEKIAQDSLINDERIRHQEKDAGADIHSRDSIPVPGTVLKANIYRKYSFGIIISIGLVCFGILDENSLPDYYKNSENALKEGDYILVRVASVDLNRNRINFTYFEEGNQSIDALNFSVRTYNCLKRAGVNTLNDIFANYPTRESLRKIRNLGQKGWEELIQKINSLGIIL